MNILTGAEVCRTVKGETYTLEEINFIRESKLTNRELALIFNVSYENITYIRNRRNSVEKLLKYQRNSKLEGSHPLAPPDGDPDKLCGYCACFTEWVYYKEYGIYGKCSISGETKHRTDPCPHSECFVRQNGYIARFKEITGLYNYK